MKYIVALSALLYTFSISAQTKQWTLRECIEYAHENNLTIKQNELNLRSADIAKDAAFANLFPDLNLSGGYFWQFGQSINPTTNTREFGDRQTASYTLSSNWILFDGLQNYKEISKARIDHMASIYNLDAIKNDISINIASAYLQVLLNKQILEVAQNQLKISQTQLDRNTKLYEAGAIPKGEQLQFEAQFALDDQSVIAAQNNVDISLLQLEQLLQLPQTEDFDIAMPNLDKPDNTLLNYTAEQIYDIALGNQPIIKNAELNVESAEKRLGIARGGFIPVISLQAQVNSNYAEDYQLPSEYFTGYGVIGYTQPNQGGRPVYTTNEVNIPTKFDTPGIGGQFTENLNQFVGIGVTVPIFNRLQVKSDVVNSEIQLDQAMLTLESQKNDLRQTIERAYTDAYASLKTFNASEKSLVASEESWKYAQKRFEEGAMNLFDYENTRNQYLNAVSQLLQSKYDYIFKVKVLEFYLTNNITL